MHHWRRPATDGAEVWISCKQPAFLSSFSRLQVIQNKLPLCSAAAYVTAGLDFWCRVSINRSIIMKTKSDFYINFCTIFSKFGSLCLAIEEVSGVTELVRVCDSQATPDPPDRSMSTSSTKSYQVRPHSLINCKNKNRVLLWRLTTISNEGPTMPK